MQQHERGVTHSRTDSTKTCAGDDSPAAPVARWRLLGFAGGHARLLPCRAGLLLSALGCRLRRERRDRHRLLRDLVARDLSLANNRPTTGELQRRLCTAQALVWLLIATASWCQKCPSLSPSTVPTITAVGRRQLALRDWVTSERAESNVQGCLSAPGRVRMEGRTTTKRAVRRGSQAPLPGSCVRASAATSSEDRPTHVTWAISRRSLSTPSPATL